MTEPAQPAPGDTPADPVDGLSYEQARDELTEVVRRLESGGLTLEQSLALWERGEQLAQACQVRLEGARQRLAGGGPDRPDPDATRPGPAAAEPPG